MYSVPTLGSLCQGYVLKYYTTISISVGISIIVVLIKSIMKNIVYYLSKFQRFSSYNHRTSYLIMNLFITYICTTVIITILLQSNFLGISFKMIIKNFINNAYLIDNASSLS